jgi:hypothetical protein
VVLAAGDRQVAVAQDIHFFIRFDVSCATA